MKIYWMKRNYIKCIQFEKRNYIKCIQFEKGNDIKCIFQFLTSNCCPNFSQPKSDKAAGSRILIWFQLKRSFICQHFITDKFDRKASTLLKEFWRDCLQIAIRSNLCSIFTYKGVIADMILRLFQHSLREKTRLWSTKL